MISNGTRHSGRGSISIISLLVALSKLLLLPSLAGAFFLPIGVLSSAEGFSSSSASSPRGDRKLHATPLHSGHHHDHQHHHQQQRTSHGSRVSALSGGGTGGSMPPFEEGGGDEGDSANADTPLPSLSLSATAGGKGDGVGGSDSGSGGEGKVEGKGGMREPVLVNVAKLESAAAAEKSKLWNVPNVLTMARVVAIPVFATVFYAPLPQRNVWCSAIFAGAAFTDWLDGYIARKQGIVSPFGSFLDPVADKLLVSTALILLSERLGPWMTICSAIILCRELAISALREWMAQLGLRETVKVGNAGKWKTATQMMAITLLLLLEPGAAVTFVNPATFMPIAKGLLYVSTVLTVTSGSGYLKAAWPALSGKSS